MRRGVAGCGAPLLVGGVAEVASSHDSGFRVARYTPDGTLDRSFGNAGVVVIRSPQKSFVANALGLQPDGKIVVVGMSSEVSSASLQLAVARYNADGSPDESFGTGGTVTTTVGDGGGQANAVTLQPDGMILVAGAAFAHGGDNDAFLIARYTPAGILDPTFGAA